MRSNIATCRLWLFWRPNTTGDGPEALTVRGSDPRAAHEFRAAGLRGPCIGLRNLVGVVWLLAALAVLQPASPVRADGLVLAPVPPRERGLQVDAAELSFRVAPGVDGGGTSPEVPAVDASRLAGETYVVQPGDTLSHIAARFHLDPGLLASRNGLKNPDYIQIGQSLKLGAPDEPPSSLLADRVSNPLAESDLVRVQFWPWPPVQGKTVAVWLETKRPDSLDLSLDGLPVPVAQQGRRGWALVPLPALIAPGDHMLTVTAGDTSVTLPLPVEAGRFDMYHIPAAVSRPILDQAGKVQAESARLQALTSKRSPSGWTPRSRFSSPLPGDYPHTSPFGSRRTYEPNPAVSAHEGEDLSAPAGTAVTAPAAGTVVLAEPLFVRGNAVVLDHGDGVFTGYWHMQELAVREGERVEPGQLLGRVGSTGLSTGAHLHWELRVNGVPVDPLQWLQN